MDDQERKKIVILGGGISSLAAAFQLTNDPEWREKFESVTVYQLGWRLGGKGASGRGVCERIEEHGLHIWIGFYENAFRVMDEAYRAMGRKPDAPLCDLDSAFKRHGYIVMNERIRDQFVMWPLACPQDPPAEAMPGRPRVYPMWWDMLYRIGQLVRQLFGRRQGSSPDSDGKSGENIPAWLFRMARMVGAGLSAAALVIASQVFETIARLVNRPYQETAPCDGTECEKPAGLANRVRVMRRRLLDSHRTLRRAFVLFDLAVSCVRGLLLTGALFRVGAIDALDRYDLREWIRRHGAAPETTESGPILYLYDLGFAFIDGDSKRPSFAAGTALRCMWRVFVVYRGAVFWKMQAGMGETVFTPLYYLLKQRGVRFEFFHRVRKLELSEDPAATRFTTEPTEPRPAVARIRMGRQVHLKFGEYSPFITAHDGLECWPTEPLYDQLVEGEALKATRDSNGRPYDLESYWTRWPDVEEVTLEAGRDYDVVVFGISLGSVPLLCGDLLAHPKYGQPWQDMAAKVKTTRTMGLQLWMKPTLKQTGWPDPSPVMDGYAEPMNTWADMSQLLPRENWPTNAPPDSIAYLCGTVGGDIPDIADHEAPEKEYRRARAIAREWLEKNARGLWPQDAVPGTAALNWNVLVDPRNCQGVERLYGQYWKMNMDPSERYVLSVADSARYRIRPDKAGFGNLVIVGDWTQCGLNVGCIEAAVMSGMKGGNAILGVDADTGIVGCPRPRSRGL